MGKIIGRILGVGCLVLLAIALAPLYVFFGWITGHIISFFCGNFVCDGLNALFGDERFTPEMLPMIGGALGFVGRFFKSPSDSGRSSRK